jgi:predicted nucleotide-binding protein (sugar kinase/HSP70/actin superfamily)
MTKLNAAKKIYLPYMCDHALALGAALNAMGVPAEVLPPPDGETLAIGRELCLGRECLPVFVATGDILRRARQPDFDPVRSVLFMPTTCGPCRFGQYRTLQRLLLDEQGLHELEIISPNAANGYQGLGDKPLPLRRLAWQGIVGVDLLRKLCHQVRPYERTAGEADRAYAEALDRLLAAIRQGGGQQAARAIATAMAWAGERFAAIETDCSEPRPWIGIVGEIYLRANPFTNQEIVRQVEGLGGRVWVAPMLEWFYFTLWGAQASARSAHRIGDWLKALLTEQVQRYDEARMLRPLEGQLTFPHESPVAELMANTRPYYEPLLGTEAALSIGKSIDFYRHGLCGVINLLPFSCMPGIVVMGLSSAIRADHAPLPWLDVIYDAQGGTNIHTRLEAFMYQARQLQAARDRDARKQP